MATPFNVSDFIADIYKAETTMTIPGRDCRIRAVYGIKFSGFNAFMITDPLGVDGLAGAVESVPLDPLPLEGEAPHADFICPEAPFEAPATEALDKESAPFAYWGVKPMLKVASPLSFYVGDKGPFTQYPVKAGSPVRMALVANTPAEYLQHCHLYQVDGGPWLMHEGATFTMPETGVDADGLPLPGCCYVIRDYTYSLCVGRLKMYEALLASEYAARPVTAGSTKFRGIEWDAPSSSKMQTFLMAASNHMRRPLASTEGLTRGEYLPTRLQPGYVMAAWTAAMEAPNVLTSIECYAERNMQTEMAFQLARYDRLKSAVAAICSTIPPITQAQPAFLYEVLPSGEVTIMGNTGDQPIGTPWGITTIPPGIEVSILYWDATTQSYSAGSGETATAAYAYVADPSCIHVGHMSLSRYLINYTPTPYDSSMFVYDAGVLIGRGISGTNGPLVVPEQYIGPKVNEGDADVLVDVVGIGNYVFSGYPWTTSVSLPPTLTFIGACSFQDSQALISVDIPSSVTSIGENAFYHCVRLQAINLPSGCSVSYNAFGRCPSLTTVNLSSGCVLSSGVFQRCSSLASFAFPPGTSSVPDMTFYGCSSLASVTIPVGVTAIGSDVFYMCSALTSITIPASVTSIGSWAFTDSGLASVVIPPAVTSLGEGAFYGCQALVGVTLASSGLTSVGDYTFYSCTSLASVTIPSIVTTIGESAFDSCSALASVTIQEGVTSIGSWAFTDCTALTSITIPASVTSIGSSAFAGCTSLTNVVFMGSTPPSMGADVFLGSGGGFLVVRYKTAAGSDPWPVMWSGVLTAPLV
jgi:hypothetical protein